MPLPKKKARKQDGRSFPPPPIAEQKRRRQEDPSIVPAPPFLLASKLLDFGCTLPVLRGACPPPEEGGWRSAVPRREWVTFPRGRLSHSFSGYYSPGDVDEDLSLGEFVRRAHPAAATTAAAPSGLRWILSTATPGDYYDFAFRTDSTTLCDLTQPSALVVLLALVLLLRAVKRICLPRFSALGRRLGRTAHGADWEEENADRIAKFGEYVYRLVYHASVSAYGIARFRNASWWDNSRGGTLNLWEGQPNQPVGPGMAWYYLVQAAYNVDALVSLAELSLTIEPVNPLAYSSALDFLERDQTVDEQQRKEQVFRLMARSRRRSILWTPLFEIKWSPNARGDFREMMAHHLVTNALVFFSSFYRFTRAGSMVFLLHDISDVPVDMSKLANFVKWKVTTVACFAVMVLTWMATRLIAFPFVICRSVLLESHEMLVLRGTLDPALHDAYYVIFYVLMGALALLHVTWFLILLRIGWTLVSTGERHDYSEHKGGEKQKRG